MKIELNVPDRMLLLQLLPSVGSITIIRVVREIREELSFTHDEHKKYSIKHGKTADGKSYVKWDDVSGYETKEVEINDVVADMLKHKLIELSKTNELDMSMIRFYEIFVEGLETPPPVLPAISHEGRPIS